VVAAECVTDDDVVVPDEDAGGDFGWSSAILSTRTTVATARLPVQHL
jgi:hypothetical protein